MARRKKSEQTYAQQQAEANDKFRAELRAEALEQVAPAAGNTDIDKFRKDAYKEALNEAKASRK